MLALTWQWELPQCADRCSAGTEVDTYDHACSITYSIHIVGRLVPSDSCEYLNHVVTSHSLGSTYAAFTLL